MGNAWETHGKRVDALPRWTCVSHAFQTRQERTRFHAVVFRLAETRFHTVVSRLVETRRERVSTLVETRLQTHGGWLLPLARLLLDRLSLALLLDALLTRFRRVSDASVSDAFLTRL